MTPETLFLLMIETTMKVKTELTVTNFLLTALLAVELGKVVATMIQNRRLNVAISKYRQLGRLW